MPQDIPWEASDTLAFTPECLCDLPSPPVLRLRAVTGRDKRFHVRMHREEGAVLHSTETIRAEILAGLAEGWTAEQIAEFTPYITAYWDARDAFEAEKKSNPKAEFTYDAALEKRIDDLVDMVVEAHRPLRRMLADNREFGALMVPIMVAVTVLDWKGIDTPRKLDRGYLTLECAEALLADLEKQHGSLAASQLFIACSKRFKLDEDEEKNSESPSPSETTQPASTATKTSDKDGKSQASVPSSKTQEAGSEKTTGTS